jgi:hypothetical protein
VPLVSGQNENTVADVDVRFSGASDQLVDPRPPLLTSGESCGVRAVYARYNLLCMQYKCGKGGGDAGAPQMPICKIATKVDQIVCAHRRQQCNDVEHPRGTPTVAVC